MDRGDPTRVEEDALSEGRLARVDALNVGARAISSLAATRTDRKGRGTHCALIPTFLNLINRAVSFSVQLKTSGKGSTGAGLPPSSTTSSLTLAEAEKSLATLERSCTALEWAGEATREEEEGVLVKRVRRQVWRAMGAKVERVVRRRSLRGRMACKRGVSA